MLVALSAAVAMAPALGTLVLVADALLVALLAFDFVRAGNPARLALRRLAPERVRLSQPFERRLEIDGVRAGLALEVHEAYPATFEALEGTPAATAPAGTERALAPGSPERARGSDRTTLVRRYRASLRGRFALGDLRMRVRGPLGLLERQARFAGELELVVEPALLRLSETLRLSASERWRDLGVRTLRRRGGLSEFESLREYVPGDEVRRIDWKAFARRAKPMVRSYQVERGQELILLVDCGRRMRAPGGDGAHAAWTKLDFALDAALELAAVALQQGDRVGVAAFERALVTYVPPTKGALAMARLSEALFPLQPSEREGELARALRELAVRHRRRATVLVLSDVADPLALAEQRAALAAGSRRHRLVFAALDDPALRQAAERAAPAGATPPDAVLRAAALELVAERARALRVLATSGARVLDALPAEAAAPMLAAWLDERRRA